MRVFRDYRYGRSEAQLSLVPRTPDLAFFVGTLDIFGQTDYFTPAAHARTG